MRLVCRSFHTDLNRFKSNSAKCVEGAMLNNNLYLISYEYVKPRFVAVAQAADEKQDGEARISKCILYTNMYIVYILYLRSFKIV